MVDDIDILMRIKANYNNYTEVEKKIADYILQNAAEIELFTAQSLAEKTNTSPSGIIRFVKKIGLKNLTEFKILLSKPVENNFGKNESFIINKRDSISEIEDILKRIMQETISGVTALTSEDVFKEVIRRLLEAETIYLFGIVSSGVVAEDLYFKLLRINKRVIYCKDETTQISNALNMTNKDAGIFFSYSGETKSVLISAEIAKEKGAFAVAVTEAKRSHLSKIVDIVLSIPSKEQEIRLGAIQSRYAQLMVADILFLGIAQHNFDNIEELLVTSKKLSDKLNRW